VAPEKKKGGEPNIEKVRNQGMGDRESPKGKKAGGGGRSSKREKKKRKETKKRKKRQSAMIVISFIIHALKGGGTYSGAIRKREKRKT